MAKKISVTVLPWGRSITRSIMVKGDRGLREDCVSEFRGNGYKYFEISMQERFNSPQSLLDRACSALKTAPKNDFWLTVRAAARKAGAKERPTNERA